MALLHYYLIGNADNKLVRLYALGVLPYRFNTCNTGHGFSILLPAKLYIMKEDDNKQQVGQQQNTREATQQNVATEKNEKENKQEEKEDTSDYVTVESGLGIDE